MSNNTTNQSINNRLIIAQVLEIENSAAWEIVSSNEETNLHMIHHRPEADLKRYGDLRGIVVDTEAKVVVCKSYGYSPTVTENKLVLNEDNLISLTDENNVSHLIDPTTSKITRGFEGTLISVFKHKGTVYRVTRKKLDPSRSRWGNSKTFIEMYWELGGPTDDELFHPESDYSPYCHNFIIVHPDVLVVSKENVGSGYIVYLGPKQMWPLSYDDCPYKQFQLGGLLFWNIDQDDFNNDPRPNAGWIDETLYVPKVSSTLTDGFVYQPENLDLTQANHHLTFGFYPSFEGSENLDRRILPGEFIVITLEDGNMLRVESTPYSWRSRVRDNNPNLKNQFYKLVSGSYITSESKYNSLYPTFTPYDTKSIVERIKSEPYVMWPQDEDFCDPDYLTTKDTRMTNIWMAFLNAIPPHKQPEASRYIGNLYNKHGELIRFLRYLSSEKWNPEDFSKRMVSIVTLTRQFAEEKVSKGEHLDKDGSPLSVKMITNHNIKNFIMKEQGHSLYRLVKEMDRWNKEQQELKSEQNKQD